jgi:hypothetical protein
LVSVKRYRFYKKKLFLVDCCRLAFGGERKARLPSTRATGGNF